MEKTRDILGGRTNRDRLLIMYNSFDVVLQLFSDVVGLKDVYNSAVIVETIGRKAWGYSPHEAKSIGTSSRLP